MKISSWNYAWKYIVAGAMISLLVSFGSSTSTFPPQVLPDVKVGPDGSSHLSYPIEVFPGTGNAVPSISLAYSSSAQGDGLIGKGWSLQGLPFVALDPLSGILFDGNDDFLGSMSGRLFKRSEDGNYYPRKEGLHKYTQTGGECGVTPCSWIMEDGSGNTYYFGETADSQIKSAAEDSVRFWLLNRFKDSNGNYYDVTYGYSEGRRIPDTISYANRVIQFSYEDRVGNSSGYSHQNPYSSAKRLAGITISAENSMIKYDMVYNAASGELSRPISFKKSVENNYGTANFSDIVFSYTTDVTHEKANFNNQDLSYTMNYPLLDRTMCRICEESCICTALPSCEAGVFPCCPDYQNAQLRCGDCALNLTKVCNEGFSITTMNPMPADIDGDGRVDLAWYSGNQNSIILRSIVDLDSAGDTGNASGGLNIEYDSFHQMADVNGDGMSDFIYGESGKLAVLYSNGNGFSSPVKYSNVVIPSTLTSSNPDVPVRSNVWSSDVNGDGLSDVITELDGKLKIYFSHGDGFDSGILRDVGGDTISHLSNFIDMNGDGLPDFVRFVTNSSDGNLYYKVSYAVSGGNSFVTRNYSVNLTAFPDQEKSWFGDFNNDGLVDFATLSGSILKIRLFNGEGFVSKSFDTNNSSIASAKIGDINGDGYTDFLYFPENGDQIIIHKGSGSSSVFSHDSSYKETVSMVPFKEIPRSGGDFCSPWWRKYIWEGCKHPEASETGDEKIRDWGVYDINGDGRDDIVSYDRQENVIYTWKSSGLPEGLITNIASGSEKSVEINYKDIEEFPGAVDLTSRSYPYLPNVSPMHPVSKIEVMDGYRRTLVNGAPGFAPRKSTRTYEYQNAKRYISTPDERESLGFARMAVEENGVKIKTHFMQTKGYGGQVDQVEQWDKAGVPVWSQNMTYLKKTSVIGTTLTLPDSMIKKTYDTDGSLLYTESSQVTSYDGYGNALKKISNGEFTIIETTAYESVGSAYITSLPAEIRMESGSKTMQWKKYVYSPAGLPLSESVYRDDLNAWATTDYEYDSYGNVVQTTDPSGVSEWIEYDSVIHGIAVKKRNVLGHTIIQSVDTDTGAVLNSTDSNGGVASIKYDAYLCKTEETHPGSTEWDMQYIYSNVGDSRNQYVETRKRDGSDGDGYMWSRTYADGSGKVYKTENEGYIDPDTGAVRNIIETVEYDEFDRPIRKSTKYVTGVTEPYYTILQYEPVRGRLVKTISPDGNLINVHYNGLTVSTTDGEGKTRSVTGNISGKPIKKIDPAGGVSSFLYDAAGKLLRMTDPIGVTTKVEYNSLGMRTKLDDPDSGLTEMSYDLAGRLISKKDGRGITVNYGYDQLGRLVFVDYPGDSDDVTYYFDKNDEGAAIPNGIGRVVEIKDGSGLTAHGYDIAGRITALHKNTDGRTFSFISTYDVAGRAATLTYPDGFQIDYSYSDSGHLQAILSDNFPIVEYQGPLAGNQIKRITGNGVETVVTYDPVYQRPDEVYTKLSDGLVVESHEYVYDNAGNITKITDRENPTLNQEFEYDILDRLVRARGVYGDLAYEYDAGGRMTKKGDYSLQYNGSQTPHAVKKLNMVGGGVVTYNYDAAGNMIQRNGQVNSDRVFSYDAGRRLRSVETVNGNILYNYTYDYAGRRAKKSPGSGGLVRYYVKDLYEFTDTGGEGSHTVFIKGAAGEIVGQLTRKESDVALAKSETDFIAQQLIRGPGTTIAGDFGSSGSVFSVIARNSGTISIPGGFATLGLAKSVDSLLAEAGLSLPTEVRRDLYATAFYMDRAFQKADRSAELLFLEIKRQFLIADHRGWIQLALLAFLLGASLAFASYTFIKGRRGMGEPLLARRAVVSHFVAPAMLVIFSGTMLSGCGHLKDKAKGTPPWLVGGGLPPGIGDDTPGVGNPNPGGGSGNPDNPYDDYGDGDIPHGQPVRGMFYFLPDHLGSTVLVTNDSGYIASGTGMGGTLSSIKYNPYGGIVRKSSGGPDIFHHKYNQSEEDPESNLYYFKSRYYDPVLGSFIQPDTILNGVRDQGLNLFMFTEGNPVKYRDPMGRSAKKDFWGQVRKDMTKGFSDAFKNAANTFNKYSGQEKYNNKSWYERSDFAKIDEVVGVALTVVAAVYFFPSTAAAVGSAALTAGSFLAQGIFISAFAGIAYGVFNNPKAFLHKPLEAVGSYALGGIDFGVSLVMNPLHNDPLPTVKHVAGGDIIFNSYSENHLSDAKATTRGVVVSAKTGVSRNTILHESQHIRQFYNGDTSYPDWSGHMPYETDAELHSGTDSYGTYAALYMIGVIDGDMYYNILKMNLIGSWNLKY